MPDSKRKNLSISPKFAEHIHQVYEQELEDKKISKKTKFTSWLSDYLDSSLQRDKLIRKLYPNFEFKGIENNGSMMIVKDTATKQYHEVTLTSSGLEITNESAELRLFVMGLPQLGRLHVDAE